MLARSGLLGEKTPPDPISYHFRAIFHRPPQCKTQFIFLQIFLAGVPILLYRLVFLWLPSRCQRFGKGQLHQWRSVARHRCCKGRQRGIEGQHGNGWQWAPWMVNEAAPRVCRFKLNRWTSSNLYLLFSGPWKNGPTCHEKDKCVYY